MSGNSDKPEGSAARYYPSLDGLRVVGVLMVFGQHYAASKAWVFGWGWTGVDIFFVLSGFLITGILYDSRGKPNRFRDFYVRRTLRIFPLYYALWIAIVVLWPVAQWQWDWRWMLWPAYVGNYARFLFLHVPGDPYRFDRITCGFLVRHWFGSPMHLYIGHFWSLCVEEQFYLIWPLVVYKVRRREVLIKICLAVIVLTPLVRWALTLLVSPQMLRMELFYRSLPSRMDALLIGGLVALYLRGPEKQWLQRWRRWFLAAAALAFAVLCLVSLRFLNLPLEGSATNWVAIFGFTFIDLMAAGIILETIHPGTLLGSLLSLRPLRSLSTISYGFYVYHDLLHDVYGYLGHRFFPQEAFAATTLSALLGSIAISILSYKLLEQPFLRLKERFSGQVHRAPRV